MPTTSLHSDGCARLSQLREAQSALHGVVGRDEPRLEDIAIEVDVHGTSADGAGKCTCDAFLHGHDRHVVRIEHRLLRHVDLASAHEDHLRQVESCAEPGVP